MLERNALAVGLVLLYFSQLTTIAVVPAAEVRVLGETR